MRVLLAQIRGHPEVLRRPDCGSGFYLTDYGRGTGSKSESANTKAGKADSGATSGGGDSAAKSDSGSSSDTKASTSDSSSAKPAASKSE